MPPISFNREAVLLSVNLTGRIALVTGQVIFIDGGRRLVEARIG
jgi:hypothetical protein